MSTIPKIIHLVSIENTIPLKLKYFIDRMKDIHPKWDLFIWESDTALSIVNDFFPEWSKIYRSYEKPVQRADIFRVMIIYLKGGFYMDIDMFCLKSLDELCDHDIVLGIEKKLTPIEINPLNHAHSIRIASYMFGSKPKHSFWIDFLNDAKTKATYNIENENDILEITGPGLLTNVFHKVKHKYTDIILLENKRPCPKNCGQASCHFGDYAAHYHVGSWRWEHNNTSRKG